MTKQDNEFLAMGDKLKQLESRIKSQTARTNLALKSAFDDQNGRWITTDKGLKVFIPDGENADKVVKEQVKKHMDDKAKNREKFRKWNEGDKKKGDKQLKKDVEDFKKRHEEKEKSKLTEKDWKDIEKSRKKMDKESRKRSDEGYKRIQEQRKERNRQDQETKKKDNDTEFKKRMYDKIDKLKHEMPLKNLSDKSEKNREKIRKWDKENKKKDWVKSRLETADITGNWPRTGKNRLII